MKKQKKEQDIYEQEFKEFVHADENLNKRGVLVYQVFNKNIIYHFVNCYGDHTLETCKNKKEMMNYINENHYGKNTNIEEIKKELLKDNHQSKMKKAINRLVSKLYT